MEIKDSADNAAVAFNILGFFFGVAAVAVILAGMSILHIPAVHRPQSLVAGIGIAILLTSLSLTNFTIAYGFKLRKKWGRNLAVYEMVLILISGIALLFSSPFTGLIAISVSVPALAYLRETGTRRDFEY